MSNSRRPTQNVDIPPPRRLNELIYRNPDDVRDIDEERNETILQRLDRLENETVNLKNRVSILEDNMNMILNGNFPNKKLKQVNKTVKKSA